MKDKILKFLKIYAIFVVFAFMINVGVMEVLIGSLIVPERQEFTAEHGLEAYASEIIFGVTMFYMLFSLPGALILHLKNFNPKKMGLLSLILGFILEFTVLQPNIPEGEGGGASWVQGWYAFNISGETIVGTLISAFYWFIVWGIPSYIFHKYLAHAPKGIGRLEERCFRA